MKSRFLALCGMIAPIVFVGTVVLGGAIRPGYSHLSETVSELFSLGSPNKMHLDSLHTIYALLLTVFGIGVLGLVRGREGSRKIGTIAAVCFIAAGCLSVTTATIYPQNPWNSLPTFPGLMHKVLSGILSLLTLVSMCLLGIWFNQTGVYPGFGQFSLISVGVIILLAVFLWSTREPQSYGC